MTECAKCGNCCERIWFSGTKGLMAQRVKDPEASDTSKEDAAFILKHWHRESGGGFNTYFRCDQFNSETRLCEAHDDRPPICRDFPWYGKSPADPDMKVATLLNKKCSFWADVPKEKWLANTDPLPSPVSIRPRSESSPIQTEEQ